MFDFDVDLSEEIEARPIAVVEAVKDMFDVAEVDEAFGALAAREMRHEDKLLDVTRAVAVDHGVFFGVKAAAVAGFVAIAAIRQTASVAVVPDRQDFAEVGARDDRANFESLAGRAASQARSEIEVNLLKGRTGFFAHGQPSGLSVVSTSQSSPSGVIWVADADLSVKVPAWAVQFNDCDPPKTCAP